MAKRTLIRPKKIKFQKKISTSIFQSQHEIPLHNYIIFKKFKQYTILHLFIKVQPSAYSLLIPDKIIPAKDNSFAQNKNLVSLLVEIRFTRDIMDSVIYFVIAFCICFFTGWVVFPRIVLFAKRKRLFDIPNARKVHSQQIPRLGGFIFMPSILFSYYFVRGLQCTFLPSTSIPIEILYRETIFYFFSSLFIIAAVGLWDDLKGLSYKYKLLGQLCVALLLVLPAPPVDNLDGLFGIYEIPHWISYPLTILIVMVIINAFNLIDGIDGLCSGLSIIALSALTVLLCITGNDKLALLSSATIGILSVFFYYNYFGKRMKIFMGDCGSLTLGCITAFLLLQLAGQHETISFSFFRNDNITIVSLMSLIFIPLFDTTRLFIQRICSGRSPFNADKNHIHHKFMEIGLTPHQSLKIILSIQILYIIANFLLAPTVNSNILFFADIAIAMLLITYLNRQAEKKSR